MRDINVIAHAVKVNCIVDKKRKDTNYAGWKWDDPYLPMALMMYFMQKYDFDLDAILDELSVHEHFAIEVQKYLNKKLMAKDETFLRRIRLVENAFRIKEWEKKNKYQFDYFYTRLSIGNLSKL